MYFFIVVIIVFVAYIFLKRRTLVKQVNMFNQLLYADKNPAAYVAEVDKILSRTIGEKEKNINRIEKTTGLMFMGEFDEVIKILSDDVKKIPPYWQHVYYHNLVMSMFLKGDTEKGNETLTDAKEVLDQYAKKEENTAAIEFIYAVADYYNGRGEERKEFFATLTENGRNDYRIAFGYYFLGMINKSEGDRESAIDKLTKAQEFGRGSFIAAYAGEAIESLKD